MTGTTPLVIGLTRPDGANSKLAKVLSDLLPEAILIDWPLLTFVPTSEPAQVRSAFARINPGDWGIFVSPRAVRFAHGLHDLTTLPAIHWAAIGSSTAASLRSLFADPPLIYQPATTQDSEGLLKALPTEMMLGHTVWLFRGETGREKLAESLRQHGVTVNPIPVYRRLCAQTTEGKTTRSQAPRGNTFEGRITDPSIWIITSPASLQCLRMAAEQVDTAEERTRLLHCNLVVINTRTEARARSLGFTGAIVRAEAPDDAALARACAVFKQD